MADLTDKSYTHRQQVPLLIRSQLRKDEHREVNEIVNNALDAQTVIDPPWIGERYIDGEKYKRLVDPY